MVAWEATTRLVAKTRNFVSEGKGEYGKGQQGGKRVEGRKETNRAKHIPLKCAVGMVRKIIHLELLLLKAGGRNGSFPSRSAARLTGPLSTTTLAFPQMKRVVTKNRRSPKQKTQGVL